MRTDGRAIDSETEDVLEDLDEPHQTPARARRAGNGAGVVHSGDDLTVVHSGDDLTVVHSGDDLTVVRTFEAPSLHARIESWSPTRLRPAWLRPEIYVLEDELPLYLKAHRNFHPLTRAGLETMAASPSTGRAPVIGVPDISACDPSQIKALASLAERGVSVVPLADVVEDVCRLHPLTPGCEEPALAPRGAAYEVIVRFIDVVVALVGCLLFLALLPFVAAAIWLEDRGPIFYAQERIGLGGKSFRLHKLRSMYVDAERDGPRWSALGDERVTWVGRVLRRTKIDELPQFFCVLLGDMSLVGPRPERPFFVNLLRQHIPHYDLRHTVRPGITGWATVKVGYGNSIETKYLAHQFDLYHLRNRSFRFDLEIAARSLYVIIACPQIISG